METNAANRIICIGAGPAGLTAAYELAKNGRSVLVLESDPHYVGGIARTIRERSAEGEFCFDIGGHRFFSKSQEVVELWNEIIDNKMLTRPRKSRIFYGGKFYPYPLDLVRTLRNLGIIESALCGISYLKARVMPEPNPKNFEQWVSNAFGARLFSIFFKTYTEKVWGMSCKEISADWAAQRIKGLSLSTAVKNAVTRALGIQSKGKIKTLIEEFLYPRLGPGMMWEMAARKIEAKGSKVTLGKKVCALAYDKETQMWNVTTTDGVTESCAEIISTMPLRELIHAIKGAPVNIIAAADKLHYRDFLIVALVLTDRKTFDDNWIYIHSPEVKVGRIQNFKAWSPDMVSNPALVCYGMEYFCFEGDGLWTMPDDALVKLAGEELVRIGLADAADLHNGYVVRQPKAYPVYDHEYEAHVDTIRAWLDAQCPHLQVVGRNGMHKYNNQDHSMMTAMLAVKNILAGNREFDVWRVNQDAEYHEVDTSSTSGQRHVPKRA